MLRALECGSLRWHRCSRRFCSILDLGRPHLFINMLRVFKPESVMSMGAWILVAFGMCVLPGLIALELQTCRAFGGALDQILGIAAGILIFGSAVFGMLLATYTGVLIGATAIPAWFLHHRLLPIHFGTAGLGSAAALLELLGHRIAPLNADRLICRRSRNCTFNLAERR